MAVISSGERWQSELWSFADLAVQIEPSRVYGDPMAVISSSKRNGPDLT